MTSAESISPEMEELSAYIQGATTSPLPKEILDRAKIHLVDTFAAMVSGSCLLPGQRAIAYVADLGGKPESCVIGTSIVTSAANAALANGMSAHADETNDVHPPTRSQPGAAVVPAALAIGERNGRSGEAVLRSIVMGYEVCARMLLALDPVEAWAAGLHLSAHGSVFGAAAAASSLLDLDERQIRHVLSFVVQEASGISSSTQDTEHIQKAFSAGRAARNGVSSALMVASGFTGVDDAFSGKPNYFSFYANDANLSEVTRGLGTEFELNRCAIKCWSTGGPTQASLQVLHEMIKDHAIKADEVERVIVRIDPVELEVVSNRAMPNICIEHLLSVMLLDGTLGFHAAHDYDRMSDPQVIAMRECINMIGDPTLTDLLRRGRAIIEIAMKDGRRFTHETMAAKGSMDNPMSKEDERSKAIDLIGPVLGDRTDQLLAAIWAFDELEDVRSLRELIQI